MTSVPAPQGQDRSSRKKLLVALIAALALCATGSAVGGYFLYQDIATKTAEVRDAADGYLHHLEAGEYSLAYGQLCSSTRESYSAAAFAARMAKQTRLSSHTFTGSQISTVNGVSTGHVDARLTFADGTEARPTILLAKESSGWKVCNYPA